MKLADFLQGKWLGHPLHPALVHVPVGAWTAAFLIDLVNLLTSASGVLDRIALWAVGAGLAGALLAIPPGVADWALIRKEKPAWQLGLWHMLLNLLATLFWATNFGLRLSAGGPPGQTTLPVLVTSTLGFLLLAAGAYVGSRMVFDHGIGVARQSKRRWRDLAAKSGSRLAEEK